MVIVFVSIYVLWRVKQNLPNGSLSSLNPFHSPPLHSTSSFCPENIVTVWKMFFCSSFVVKITNMVWEILGIHQRTGRFSFFLLPIYTGWKSFLPAIFWWMGWCQAEFADLLLQPLARVLTDGWTLISSNWWCQLGMFTFLSFQVEEKYRDKLYKIFCQFLWCPFVRRVWEASLFLRRWKERSSLYYTVDILAADGFYNC